MEKNDDYIWDMTSDLFMATGMFIIAAFFAYIIWGVYPEHSSVLADITGIIIVAFFAGFGVCSLKELVRTIRKDAKWKEHLFSAVGLWGAILIVCVVIVILFT